MQGFLRVRDVVAEYHLLDWCVVERIEYIRRIEKELDTLMVAIPWDFDNISQEAYFLIGHHHGNFFFAEEQTEYR